jgi:gluconolactonase
VWFADEGALYFSNMKFSQPNPAPLNGPAAELVRFTPPSSFEVILENSATNGLAIDLDGGLIACTHDTRSVSRIDLLTGARTIVADKHDGKRFNSPNDLVLRPDGHLYFSDPDWQLSQTSEQPMAVYWRAPSGEVTLVDLLDKPNGVALSPDGQWLYGGAIDGKSRRYPLASSGAPGPAQPFASVPGPDGMTTDCAGNVYISGSGGVAVFDPEGAPLGKISGTGSATNVAFGGPDRKTLYITAGKALHAVTLDIPGYPY